MTITKIHHLGLTVVDAEAKCSPRDMRFDETQPGLDQLAFAVGTVEADRASSN